MSKQKSPLLSLGASGTVGDALTYQKTLDGYLARKKPTPTDKYTLPQAYNRWLYSDQTYVWHSLSAAQRLYWRKLGSSLGLPGFACFMRSYLTDLTDLELLWHLDYQSGGITPDASRQNNIGTVFGASVVDGLIDHAFYFDGVDDRVVAASVIPTPPFSCSLFFRAHTLPAGLHVILGNARMGGGGLDQGWAILTEGTNLRVLLGVAALWATIYQIQAISTMTWYHVAITFDSGLLNAFVDGVQRITNQAHGNYADWAMPVRMACFWPQNSLWFKGEVDHASILSRVEPQSTFQKQSIRRYPV